MTSQITKNMTFNLEYTIPRIELGARGRQNRSGMSNMVLYAGMALPIEFNWGSTDGIPLNTAGMCAKLAFWTVRSAQREDRFSDPEDYSRVVLTKVLEVPDPHAGSGYTLLRSQDTSSLWQASREHPIRWGVVLVNESGDVFPLEVTPKKLHGTVEFYLMDEMPLGEILRSA